MNSKAIILIAFVLMTLAQLYVPGKMIWDKEHILIRGTSYQFRTAPIDPVDIFRGKYIDLYFEGNVVTVADEKEWIRGEQVYGLLTTDAEGYAQISSLEKEAPQNGEDYLKLSINFVTNNGENDVQVRFPFDRFYMEESKAYQAELSYRESSRDSSSTTYALVSIWEGQAVINDVLIDGVPIREVAQTMLENTDP